MAEAFDMYQRSEIGKALTETLIQMVGRGPLSPEPAIAVLLQFDQVPSAAAAARPLASSPRTISPPTLQNSRMSNLPSKLIVPSFNPNAPILLSPSSHAGSS